MRGSSVVVMLCGVLVSGTSVSADETPPPVMIKNMKDIDAATVDLAANLENKDFAAVAKNAAALQKLFAGTLHFWQERMFEDAVTQAQLAAKTAGEIATAAKGKNENGVLAARKALIGACTACHNAHRVKKPDGKYEIK